MSLTCFNCGKEIGDYAGEEIKLTACPECKAAEPPHFYRAAKDPKKLLADILLHGDYTDIIGIESDAGATRIYTSSPAMVDAGMVMMHHIRSEEVPLDAALKERLAWGAKPSHNALGKWRMGAE